MSFTKYHLYDELVRGQEDFVGHIAYSIYKSEKIQSIKDYCEKNHCEDMPDLEKEEFKRNAFLRAALYRENAENFLKIFRELYVAEAVKKQEKFYEEEIHLLDKQYDEKYKAFQKRNYWAGVGQNVISTVFTTAIWGFILFIIYIVSLASERGLLPLIKNFLNGL